MRRILELLTMATLAMSACAERTPSRAPALPHGAAAEPAPTPPGRVPTPRLTLGPGARESYLAELAPGVPDARRVTVPAGRDVDVAVEHVTGALDRVTIRIIDTGEDAGGGKHTLSGPRVLGDDGLTCGEQGCTFTTLLRAGHELAPADEGHVLLVRLEGAAAATFRVRVTVR